MIKFRCDQCHNLIEVDEKFVGKAGTCQKCGAPVVVPPPEVPVSTGLDSLRDAAEAPGAEHYGAYGKARDAAWKDPALAVEATPKPKPEEPAVPLPDIPAEIIAAAKARKRQNMQYIIGAALITLIVLVLLFPLLAPKPKEAPKPITPAPTFGAGESTPE